MSRSAHGGGSLLDTALRVTPGTRRKLDPNWTPTTGRLAFLAIWKGAICKHFAKGERRDSNPRPPGPQHELVALSAQAAQG